MHHLPGFSVDPRNRLTSRNPLSVIAEHESLLKRHLKFINNPSRLSVTVAVRADNIKLTGTPVPLSQKKRYPSPAPRKRYLMFHQKSRRLIADPFVRRPAQFDILINTPCIS